MHDILIPWAPRPKISFMLWKKKYNGMSIVHITEMFQIIKYQIVVTCPMKNKPHSNDQSKASTEVIKTERTKEDILISIT